MHAAGQTEKAEQELTGIVSTLQKHKGMPCMLSQCHP